MRFKKAPMEIVKEGRMGKKLQADIIEKLELAIRDVGSEGAYTAQMAMEEVSSVAESLMTIMVERTGAERPLLPNGAPVTPAAMLDGPDEEVIEAEPAEELPPGVPEEVEPERKMIDGVVHQLVRQRDGTEHWVKADIIGECYLMLSSPEGYDQVPDLVKHPAAFLKASSGLPWPVSYDIVHTINEEMMHG